MPRASQPHTPGVEMAAQRAHAAEAGMPAVLTPDIADFCQSGISVVVAVGRPDAVPIAGLGCGCRILPDGRMRLLLPRPGNEELLAVAERGARIAVTFSQPFTHRSIQVKGSRAVAAVPDDEDRREAVRQSGALRRELVEVDYAAAFAEAYCRVDPDIIVAIDITAEAAFVQTPGPGAGAELKS